MRRALVSAVLCLSLVTGQVAAAPGGSAAPVQEAATIQVFPVPGTPTVSPSSQLSFRGALPSDLGDLSVTGSTSGAHPGRWLAHGDGQGVSFVPDTGFAPGEAVRVTTSAPIAGATGGVIEYQIAQPIPEAVAARQAPPPGVTEATAPAAPGPTNRLGAASPPSGEAGPYRSRPDLHPPAVNTVVAPGRSPGLLFTTANTGPAGVQTGPLIYDDTGEPVWFRPNSERPSNLTPITYRGQPALTYFEGEQYLLVGAFRGDFPVLDTAYREIARIRAGNGYQADMHELQVTPEGDKALLVIYAAVRQDLSPYGGPRDATVMEGIVQEVDLATGAVTFEWHSLSPGGIPVTDSYEKLDAALVDYIHLNSAAYDSDGNLLVNARNTSAFYKVDKTTGAVRWRFGGKRNQYFFTDGDGGPSYAHDVRRRADGTIGSYDNGVLRQPPYSRGVAWQVDEVNKVARVARLRRHSPELFGVIVGSFRQQSNGNDLVSFGNTGNAAEYDAAGNKVFESQFATAAWTYRTMRAQWRATPAVPPDLAVDRFADTVTGYASWNGATDVARWQILGGPDQGNLRPLGVTDRTGFETRIRAAVAPTDRVFAVRAVGPNGAVLGTSRPTPDAIEAHYRSLGGAGSFLGAPVGGERGVGFSVVQDYQNGAIYWSPVTGAWEVHGALLFHYRQLGGPFSPLGLPVSDEAGASDGVGRFSRFQLGWMYWTPATGAHEVHGANLFLWIFLGLEQGLLGYPVTDQRVTPGGTGVYNHFQTGSIYQSAATGAREVHGAIRAKYASLGWERSFLGFPATNESITPDFVGRFNRFQGGSVYWTPATGAHEVHGAIRVAWGFLGFERGRLGYPTSDEFSAGPGIRQSNFQGGWIRWYAADGHIEVAFA